MYIIPINDKYVPFGSGLPRSPGLHLTDIIKSLRDALGLGKVAEGWDMGACADAGFLWEEAFSIAYRDKVEELAITRPGETVLDGIIMSPDGVGGDSLGNKPLVNHELKYTWRSCNKPPQDDFYWDTQFKCYCKGLSSMYGLPITDTELHVFYSNGNYKGSGPQPLHWQFQYTQEEIDTAWGMVVRHAKEKRWL